MESQLSRPSQPSSMPASERQRNRYDLERKVTTLAGFIAAPLRVVDRALGTEL
jgi:hypothetical protein